MHTPVVIKVLSHFAEKTNGYKQKKISFVKNKKFSYRPYIFIRKQSELVNY